jgi:penicillin-binding protein 1C
MKRNPFLIGILTLPLILQWGGSAANPGPADKNSPCLRIPALPTYQVLRRAYVKSESTLLDRHGEIIHELRTDLDGRRLDWVPLWSISPALKQAVVAAEDKRFYEHSGIDYRALAAALWQSLTSASLRGASSITMQLASRLDHDLQSIKGRKSIWQKGKQALAACQMEREWSKEQILEAYLNLVTFRGELQGIAAASRGLFGKEPHGLDHSESLILASLIRAPGASLTDLTRRALRLGESLRWATDSGKISSRGKEVLMGPHYPRPHASQAPHLARQLLKDLPSGSTLQCSVDGEIQSLALDLLAHSLLPLRSQNVRDGAVLVVENQTGEVLAYASHSGEPSRTSFVDGVKAKRQAGSTLKPFLYALAFDEHILTPASLLEDSPLDVPVPGGLYHPRNYEGQFQGLVPARDALASSLNVPAVRALSLVGEESFLHTLRSIGIRELEETGDFYGPALALGSADVSLWELVNAYRTLANGGRWNELKLSITPGKNPPQKRVFSPEAAFLISDILSDREARSLTFGLENPLSTRFWTAVKTGTTKDMRDNWCIGYSQRFTVGVWVGNFSGEPMWNVSGISGAAPIWVEMMNRLHRGESHLPKKPPPGLVKAKRSLVSAGKESTREEWFIRGTEPVYAERKPLLSPPRIVYPPAGTVIALDPDIPPELQKVFFVAQPLKKGSCWNLNGRLVATSARTAPWTPRAGKYFLALVDHENGVLDSVHFEVRGVTANGEE